jgi:hypothetical protein
VRAPLLIALAALAWPRAGNACAACGCGDPTLTALGNEKPLAGRMRAAAEVLLQSQRSGTPLVNQLTIAERRLRLQAAWAPSARIFLLATLPLVDRDVSYVNLARRRVTGIGDLELRARAFLWEDRGFSPRHLIAATAGARLPTAPWGRDPRGSAWPAELQAGTGAVMPLLGLSYATFRFPWSGYVGVEGSAPLWARAELRPGRSLVASGGAQRQVGAVAARLGIDVRADEAALENGRVDPDSGGLVGFLSPALLATPVTHLLLVATLRVPVAARLFGQQRPGVIVEIAAAYDF